MKISIIIPVYNTDKYLEECLNSVLNQDYSDFEVLVIDDGSTDKSLSIIERYTNKYTNVYCFHQNNQGVGAARNLGLDHARGDFICFVDSDDAIANNYCSYLLNIIGNADIAVAGRDKYIDNVYVGTKTSDHIFASGPGDAVNYLLSSKYNTRPVWGKLFRRSVIGNKRFIEGHIFEEVRFSTDTFLSARKIIYADKSLYFYKVRNGSIMTEQKAKHVIELPLAVAYVYHALLKDDLFLYCKREFMLWLVRVSLYNCKLVSELNINITDIRAASKILSDIYIENGGVEGRI